MMGYSRGTGFYRFKETLRRRRRIRRCEPTPARTDLRRTAPRRPRLRRSSSSFIAGPGRLMARSRRIANELPQASAIQISRRPGCCGLAAPCAILRTMKKRLKALEAKVAQEGLVLTESQNRRVGEGQERKGGAWRVRERRMSGAIAAPRPYVLRRQHEGGRPHLPWADLYRHLRQGRLRQAL